MSLIFQNRSWASLSKAVLTRIDVYETLCPQQMLVHKGGQINNVHLITGVGSAKMPHLKNCSVKIFKEHCEYLKKNIKKKRIKIIERSRMGNGVDANQELKWGVVGDGWWGRGFRGCEPRVEGIVIRA